MGLINADFVQSLLSMSFAYGFNHNKHILQLLIRFAQVAHYRPHTPSPIYLRISAYRLVVAKYSGCQTTHKYASPPLQQ
jgi:hypothetical protein